MGVGHIHRGQNSSAFIFLLKIFFIELVEFNDIGCFSAIHFKEALSNFKDVAWILILGVGVKNILLFRMLVSMGMRSSEIGLTAIAMQYLLESKRALVLGQARRCCLERLPLPIISLQVLDISFERGYNTVDLNRHPRQLRLRWCFTVSLYILFAQTSAT